jgi:hypothetical protein
MKYRPHHMAPAEWNRIKDFCRQAVADYGPANSRSATETLSTVTLFVLWATREEHAPLEREALFHPTLMGRYLRGRVADKNSAAYRTLHSRLFRVANAITNAITNADHPTKLRATNAIPVHEYTARELAELESWAATQKTPFRRRHAYTVLALMGGAGLAMTETLNIRRGDIQRDSRGYSVSIIGPRPRVIPIHSSWERYLDDPLQHVDADQYVLFDGKTPDGRASTLRHLYRGPHPAPNPQWLRDTWTLTLLRALPLNIVMQACGTSDVARFRRYLSSIRLDFAQWHDAVRNPAAHRTRMDDTHDSAEAYGEVVWAAADNKLRDDVAPVNLKLGDTPHPAGRPRPRDRAQGNYGRLPMSDVRHEQMLTTDSTAFHAGASVVPFKRPAASEAHDDGDRQADKGKKHAPGYISALEAEWAPERSRKKSLYEGLPPGVANLPTAPEDIAAEGNEGQAEAAASEFAALRSALLAEARRSARGGKR